MEAKIKQEIERLLGKMEPLDDTMKLREYALTVESLVMSLIRIKQS